MIGEGERVGKGGRVSLICMNYLNVFTPTLDRDAGEEKVCRGQNGEDLDEGGEILPENTQEGNRQTELFSMFVLT